MPSRLHDLLVCPACFYPLVWLETECRCNACTCVYPIVDGIPVLLLEKSTTKDTKLEHFHPRAHVHKQAEFFDQQVEEEFEITRPHGTPGLYRWLLGEKFRRSVVGLQSMLPGATALTVCGGSGMDAEFLARAGARVIVSDISLGAIQRAKERARRFGFSITPVVADVECLPFRDRSVDLVYVHDGLHHLEDPLVGLAEMARVAARAVSVSEPARATLTALAIRFGWALEREEAGNRVARVTTEEVVEELRSKGFRILHAERYAMYYRHHPGCLMRVLSLPGMLSLTMLAWRIVNTVIGRVGNKLSLVAIRNDHN